MSVFNFCTYNTRGLRDSGKRRKLFTYFHRNNHHFVFLQETHSTKADEKFWSNEWGGNKIFFAHGTNLRGVVILCKPIVTLSVINADIDSNGRYIVLNVNIYNEDFVLINVYSHNNGRVDLFTKIENYLCYHDCNNIIWGGDLNLVLSLHLDRIGGLPQTNFRAREKLIDLMKDFDLIDIWRERNPKCKLFTWHSSIDVSIYCRLDVFSISNHLKQAITNTSIHSLFGSDHSSVSLTLQIGIPRGRGMWKLNTSLLDDPVHIDLVKHTISDTLNTCSNENP